MNIGGVGMANYDKLGGPEVKGVHMVVVGCAALHQIWSTFKFDVSQACHSAIFWFMV